MNGNSPQDVSTPSSCPLAEQGFASTASDGSSDVAGGGWIVDAGLGALGGTPGDGQSSGMAPEEEEETRAGFGLGLDILAGRSEAAPPSPAETIDEPTAEAATAKMPKPERTKVGWDPNRAIRQVDDGFGINHAPERTAGEAEAGASEPLRVKHLALACSSEPVAAAAATRDALRSQGLSLGIQDLSTSPYSSPSKSTNDVGGGPSISLRKTATSAGGGGGGGGVCDAGDAFNAYGASSNTAARMISPLASTPAAADAAAAALERGPAPIRVGWNRVGNPAIPATVRNSAQVNTAKAQQPLAAAQSDGSTARRPKTNGDSGMEGRQTVAPESARGAAEERDGVLEVPLQVRAVLLYASTHRGIDLRKWFDVGEDGGDRGSDEGDFLLLLLFLRGCRRPLVFVGSCVLWGVVAQCGLWAYANSPAVFSGEATYVIPIDNPFSGMWCALSRGSDEEGISLCCRYRLNSERTATNFLFELLPLSADCIGSTVSGQACITYLSSCSPSKTSKTWGTRCGDL